MKGYIFLFVFIFGIQSVFAQVTTDQWVTQEQIDKCAKFNGFSLIIIRMQTEGNSINICGSVLDKAIENGYTIKTDILGPTFLGDGCTVNCAITKYIVLERNEQK